MSVTEKSEKVVYLKDELLSIKYLKELIEGIRCGEVKKFVCIAGRTIDLAKENLYAVDENGDRVDDEEAFNLTDNYFFGDCSTSELLGLNARMAHVLNQYMDNYKYIEDE